MKILRIVDGRPGVSVPYPEKIAAHLAAQYGGLNTRALELVNAFVIPAIASGSQARVKSAIAQVERTLATEYSPGKRFAEVEMQAILSELLSSCRFSRVPGRSPKPLGSLTSRPDDDFRLLVVPRTQRR